MVADPLMLLPSLRPWQRAGVEFLLADQPLPAPWSLCIAAAPAAPRTASPAHRPAHSSPQEPVPHRRPVQAPAPSVTAAGPAASRNLARSASGEAVSPARSAPNSVASPAASGSVTAPQTIAPPAAVLDLAPNLWPAPWQERLKKTAPAAVLWTYWTLGEDLCGRPNPERRALLKRLLADLAHPAGTHSFWPPALPNATDPAAGELQANADVFWSGVQTLKARALVVMGSPAIKALALPPRLRPFQQTRHNGRLIIVLRDVDFLVQETHRYDAVREFLKQALAPFGR